ncbi:MAG: hypothetical protein R3A47_01765 [Polyangiales bacterium]
MRSRNPRSCGIASVFFQAVRPIFVDTRLDSAVVTRPALMLRYDGELNESQRRSLDAPGDRVRARFHVVVDVG